LLRGQLFQGAVQFIPEFPAFHPGIGEVVFHPGLQPKNAKTLINHCLSMF